MDEELELRENLEDLITETILPGKKNKKESNKNLEGSNIE
jgi:hypothetical protein